MSNLETEPTSTPDTEPSLPAVVESAPPPAVVESPGPSGLEGIPSEPRAHSSEPAPSSTEVSVFKPRDKFKAWKVEHEVPQWITPFIKDQDTETKVIKLLEKSAGLDIMKPKFEEVKTELAASKLEFGKMLGQINDLRAMYQRGDIDMWLAHLQIPQERMLQWALDKVNYSKLPPDQQRLLDQKTDAERKAVQLEKQQGTTEQHFLEQQRAIIALQLESGLTRPDVSTFVDAFDSRVGTPGAFRKEVIQAGEFAYARSQGKVLLSPDQAIQTVMEKYKNFLSASQPQATPGQTVVPPEERVITSPPKTASIPNVTGKPSSPMRSSPTSIDDLRKIQKDMLARNG